MKSQGYILIVILIIGSLALYPLESWAGTADEYVFVVPVPKKSQEMKTFDVVPLLEIGDLPFPRPSRRQIIDADKGPSCLACHRLPYPTAPQKPAKPGEEVLSSIQNTPQGGWRLLTPSAKNHHEKAGGWSPDGKQITYSVKIPGGEWDIWVMDADGKNQYPLISSPTIDKAPAWSPDGKKVAYVSNETEKFGIWTVDVGTLERRHLTPAPGSSFVPHWSPDGSQILYHGWRGDPVKGGYDLALVKPDGNGHKDLVPSPVDEISSRWSPDGSRILFWSWRTGNPEIFLVKADGSGMRQLTDNLAWDVFPCWSPDGEKIAFDSDRMGNFDIWVMEVEK